MTTQETHEKELILKGLYRDRDELSSKLTEVEKLIKKIKSNSFSLIHSPVIEDTPISEVIHTPQENLFPYKAEMKFQILAIIDMIGFACKLKDIQDKYKELTGSLYSVRETLRTLNKHNVIKLLRPLKSDRGLYWVKTEWLDADGNLMDKHKFYGFDQLYKPETIEFV